MVLAAGRQRFGVQALSGGLGVSANHLSKVVQALHAEGWVRTIPGRGGGVELAIAADHVRVGDVVRAIEPDIGLVACMRGPGQCPLEQPCRLVGTLVSARAAFLRELDRVTIKDLVHRRSSRLISAAELVGG